MPSLWGMGKRKRGNIQILKPTTGPILPSSSRAEPYLDISGKQNGRHVAYFGAQTPKLIYANDVLNARLPGAIQSWFY